MQPHERMLRPLRDATPDADAGGEVQEVVDITEFQSRLRRLRERNRETLEQTPAQWAKRVSDIQEAMRQQRRELENTLFEEMLTEEVLMLERLEDVDRNLRNMIRLYRQLVDERNNVAAGVAKLHSWIREVESKQGRKVHRDHGVDLAAKYFVEYLSKQAWVFDNQSGWELEENPRRRRESAGSTPA